jgi:DNA-binding MarR family transcriptional regulator
MTKKRNIPYLEDIRLTRHVCLAEGLRAANRAVTKYYSDRMSGCDIGAAQFSLLMRLYYLGESTMLQLAKHMDIDRTTLARNVDLLEKGGFVEVSEGRDRRSRLVKLTDRGFEALNSALPKWLEAQRQMRELIGEAMWQNLIEETRILAKV